MHAFSYLVRKSPKRTIWHATFSASMSTMFTWHFDESGGTEEHERIIYSTETITTHWSIVMYFIHFVFTSSIQWTLAGGMILLYLFYSLSKHVNVDRFECGGINKNTVTESTAWLPAYITRTDKQIRIYGKLTQTKS